MVTLDQIDPATAVSFSGHRPERLPGKGNTDSPDAQKLTAILQKEIIASIDRGMTAFIHGCMAGFDLYAIEQVIAVKPKYPHIKIISIAPYRTHFFTREKCWTPEWVSRAREVFKQHDFGTSLAEHYRPGIYYERNDALIQYSSLLICYNDGHGGGTQDTVRKARNNGLIVKNLYKEMQNG